MLRLFTDGVGGRLHTDMVLPAVAAYTLYSLWSVACSVRGNCIYSCVTLMADVASLVLSHCTHLNIQLACFCLAAYELRRKDEFFVMFSQCTYTDNKFSA